MQDANKQRNKQSSALTHREHNKEMIRGERLEIKDE